MPKMIQNIWGQRVKQGLFGAIIASVALVGLAPAANAASYPVEVTGDFNIDLPQLQNDLIVVAGSNADEITVDGNDLFIAVHDGATLTLESPQKYRLTNDGGYDECNIVDGVTRIVITTDSDVTITPPGTFCQTGGGGGGGGGGGTSSVVNITNPESGDIVYALDSLEITWTYSGTIDKVDLEYSIDNGTTYTDIATDLDAADKSYDWTTPYVDTTQALIKAYGYDGSTLKDTDVSELFIISYEGVDPPEEEEEEPTTGEPTDQEFPDGANVAPGTGLYGPSPYDGSTQEILHVEDGWFIRSPNYPTVYLVEDDGTGTLTRRPFWDATAFFTYADSWDEIHWVTDATLPTLPLNAPMLPNPGVVLVKIQSVPNVYWEETGSIYLRWITTEEVAILNFGPNWSHYVIDVDPTLFGYYDGYGDDVIDDEAFDRSVMKYRTEIEIEKGNQAEDYDSDGDGLSDLEELTVYNTNPMNPDTDGDGYPDGEEIDTGHDPLTMTVL